MPSRRPFALTISSYILRCIATAGLAVKLENVEGLHLRSLVNKDDIVPRLSLANAKEFVDRLVASKEKHLAYYNKDKAGSLARASDGWREPHRKQDHVNLNKGAQTVVDSCGGGAAAPAASLVELGSREKATVPAVALSPTPAVGEHPDPEPKSKRVRLSDAGAALGSVATAAGGNVAAAAAAVGGWGSSIVNSIVTSPTNATAPAAAPIRLVVPGMIFHTFDHHGQTRCAVVDHNHITMRKLTLSRSMVDDHLGKNMMLSFREIAAAKVCSTKPSVFEVLMCSFGDWVLILCLVLCAAIEFLCLAIGLCGSKI
jgi:hypothetical protein